MLGQEGERLVHLKKWCEWHCQTTFPFFLQGIIPLGHFWAQELPLSDSWSVMSKYRAKYLHSLTLDVQHRYRSLEQRVLLYCTEFLEVVQKISPFQLPLQGRSPANANIWLTDTIKGRVLGHPSHPQRLQNQFLRFGIDASPTVRPRTWTCSYYGLKPPQMKNLKIQISDNSLFHAISCNFRSRNIYIKSRRWQQLTCSVRNDLTFPCLFPSIYVFRKFE